MHTDPLTPAPARRVCGFTPPTPGYLPCTRDFGHGGPCAHQLVEDYYSAFPCECWKMAGWKNCPRHKHLTEPPLIVEHAPECFSSTIKLSWFARLGYRLFPFRHTESPIPPADWPTDRAAVDQFDVLHVDVEIFASWRDRLRFLISGRARHNVRVLSKQRFVERVASSTFFVTPPAFLCEKEEGL